MTGRRQQFVDCRQVPAAVFDLGRHPGMNGSLEARRTCRLTRLERSETVRVPAEEVPDEPCDPFLGLRRHEEKPASGPSDRQSVEHE